MKLLSQAKNKHFYFGYKGCLYNSSKENCLIHIDEKFLPEFNIEESVKFYPSGALVTIKNSNKINLIFFNNAGERLIDIDSDNLNKPVKNIESYVCSTGIYLSYMFLDNTTSFSYHTYKGGVLTSEDENKLDKKIEKYEHFFGIYEDDTIPQKRNAPYSKQILEAMGQNEEENNF